MPLLTRLLAAAALTLSPACAHDSGDESDEVVTIRFEARINDLPFACGTRYTGLGADGVVATPRDFRFYVHDLRLVTAAGEELPVALTNDAVYQSDDLALLDFEDGTGACIGGTTPRNTTVWGTVGPRLRHGGHDGHVGYTGLRFRIGVPPELDHAGPGSGLVPLNEPTMAASWSTGHVFFATGGKFGDPAFDLGVQVGSSGCEGARRPGALLECSKANRPEIALDGFDPARNRIIIDWDLLFADLELGSPEAACDADEGVLECSCYTLGPESVCSPIFGQLGLDWHSGDSLAAQRVFRVR